MIVHSHLTLLISQMFMFLQGLMTSSDTGPMSRCTLLMSFLHAHRHRRLPTPFIGPIPIGSFCIPSPSSLCLARRNVRNSSDSSMVRSEFYTILSFSVSSSTDPGQQSSLSYKHMVARILLRVSVFYFCINCTESLSYLVHTAHWRQVHFRLHRPLPCDISHMYTAKHTDSTQCWKLSLGYYALESCSSLSTERDTVVILTWRTVQLHQAALRYLSSVHVHVSW